MKAASGEEIRHWTVLQPLPAPLLVGMAKQAEAAGLHGCFAPQVYGPPFLPLAVAAGVTQRLQLASGIAIASARSPFETAMAALDMDRISGGRFTLGIGTSVLAWSRGVFGAPEHKPLAHLRETVAAIRHIVGGAHKGLEPFEGEYYRADFEQLQPIEPPLREQIPIWIAALRAPLVRLAARIGDGLIGHPMWSFDWIQQHMLPEFEAALSGAGRRREDVELSLWPWAAPNPNEAEAIEDARPTMAFYGGAAQYESFFEAHGFLDVVRKLQAGVQKGDYRSVAHHVPDEMVRTFVAVGEPDKVREQVSRFAELSDSLCVVPPVYALSPQKMLYYAGMIAKTFYGA